VCVCVCVCVCHSVCLCVCVCVCVCVCKAWRGSVVFCGGRCHMSECGAERWHGCRVPHHGDSFCSSGHGVCVCVCVCVCVSVCVCVCVCVSVYVLLRSLGSFARDG